MDLSQIGEFELIERIKRKAGSPRPSIIMGIGDDSAAIVPSPQCISLVTQDLLIEGIHFNLSYFTGYNLGKKALSVNLSDIAAMGGIPKYFLASLAIPKHLSIHFIDEFYQGMMDLAGVFDVSLIGGDTSSCRKELFINITVIGEVPREQLILRNGARPGDYIFVTGSLGDSCMGLKILQDSSFQDDRNKYNYIIERHLSPWPRIREGRFLAERRLASAMIDISDGLLSDLRHICVESGVGATLWLEKIPLSEEYREYFFSHAKSSDHELKEWDPALTGGEDYELIFTVPPQKWPIVEEFIRTGMLNAAKIGEINEAKERIRVILEGDREITFQEEGYRHF